MINPMAAASLGNSRAISSLSIAQAARRTNRSPLLHAASRLANASPSFLNYSLWEV
jgi:hypothetical protein